MSNLMMGQLFLANWSAVALPIPEVDPVMRQVFIYPQLVEIFFQSLKRTGLF